MKLKKTKLNLIWIQLDLHPVGITFIVTGMPSDDMKPPTLEAKDMSRAHIL
jgi:hypothetical protein